MTSAPFQHAAVSTRSISRNLLIALVPALLLELWMEGETKIPGLLLSYILILLLEFLSAIANEKPVPRPRLEFSLPFYLCLFWFLLPPSVPVPLAVTCAVLVSLLLRQSFGGMGRYPLSPAMTALLFVAVLDPSAASVFLAGTAMEPLRITGSGGALQFADQVLLVEIQNLLLLGAALLLLVRGLIPWQIPLLVIAALTLFYALDPAASGATGSSLLALYLHGKLPLIIFFLAPEPGVVPAVSRARLAYGLLVGICLVFLGNGQFSLVTVVVSILLANLCAPLLDALFRYKATARHWQHHRGTE